MCDLCEIVKAAVKDLEMQHELVYKDGICVAVIGATSKQPIFIRREHENQTLKIFKEDMKKTAQRLYPDLEVDEPPQEEGDHYYFFMKPKKEKKE